MDSYIFLIELFREYGLNSDSGYCFSNDLIVSFVYYLLHLF